MRYYIRTHNLEKAIARYEHLVDALVDAEPAMTDVTLLMMEYIRRTFESQGRRGGGSWAQITDEWLTRKAEKGWDLRIGYARHTLSEAFTKMGAAHQILEIGPHEVTLESDLPYAATQQYHRPFIKFTKNDRVQMAALVTKYLAEAWYMEPSP